MHTLANIPLGCPQISPNEFNSVEMDLRTTPVTSLLRFLQICCSIFGSFYIAFIFLNYINISHKKQCTAANILSHSMQAAAVIHHLIYTSRFAHRYDHLVKHFLNICDYRCQIWMLAFSYFFLSRNNKSLLIFSNKYTASRELKL